MKVSEYPEEWSEEQCAFFTKAYRFMITSQQAMRHPAAPSMPDEHWHTIAHNAAFLCATLHGGDDLSVWEHGDEGEIPMATTVVGPPQ